MHDCILVYFVIFISVCAVKNQLSNSFGNKFGMFQYYNSLRNEALNMLHNLNEENMLMVILVGLPGCGKSTFSNRIINSLPAHSRSNWRSLNQDALKTRKAVFSLAKLSLEERKNVIIDRCNFDYVQRKHWIELASSFIGCSTLCVLLPDYLDINKCIFRAFERGNDGIHDANVNWNFVCNRMANDFRYPIVDEGFSGIYKCENENDVLLLIKAIQRIKA
jgi:aprataxin